MQANKLVVHIPQATLRALNLPARPSSLEPNLFLPFEEDLSSVFGPLLCGRPFTPLTDPDRLLRFVAPHRRILSVMVIHHTGETGYYIDIGFSISMASFIMRPHERPAKEGH